MCECEAALMSANDNSVVGSISSALCTSSSMSLQDLGQLELQGSCLSDSNHKPCILYNQGCPGLSPAFFQLLLALLLRRSAMLHAPREGALLRCTEFGHLWGLWSSSVSLRR